MLCIQTPKTFKDVLHHLDICQRLKSLIQNWTEIPHLVFYGPLGSGKKTLIGCMMREHYGNSIDNTMCFKFSYFSVHVSDVHLEYSVCEKTSSDFIGDLIDRIKSMNVQNASFHTVIIHGFEKVNRNIILSMCHILEKYIHTARFIFVCTSFGKFTPVQKHCLCIRVPIVSIQECSAILNGLEVPMPTERIQQLRTRYKGNIFDIINHSVLETKCKISQKITLKNIDDILLKLTDGILHQNKALIQTSVLELFIIPLSSSILIKELCLYMLQKQEFKKYEYKIASLCASYEYDSVNVSNPLYAVSALCLILSCVVNT